MSSQGGGSTHDLIVESWIMYGVGILFFIVRLLVYSSDSVAIEFVADWIAVMLDTSV